MVLIELIGLLLLGCAVYTVLMRMLGISYKGILINILLCIGGAVLSHFFAAQSNTIHFFLGYIMCMVCVECNEN